MKPLLEGIVFLGSLVAGGVACLITGWKFMQQVRGGRRGRIAATMMYGATALLLAMIPTSLAWSAWWIGKLAGFPFFSPDGGELVGVGVLGSLIALGSAVLFAVVMAFQAL